MTDLKPCALFSIHDYPPTGKFVAFFGDGSGAEMYMRSEIGDGYVCYTEATGDDCGIDDLIGSGFTHWLPLPDSFKFWFERD